MKISACMLGVLLAMVVGSAANAQDNACRNEASLIARVDFVTTDRAKLNDPVRQQQPDLRIGLRDTIYVHVDKLPELLAELESCRASQPNKQLVLWLDGLPLKDVTWRLVGPPADGFLMFYLERVDAAKSAWNRIMGHPTAPQRPVAISVGFADQFPVRSGISVNMQIVPLGWAALALVFWLIVCGVFLKYVKTSSLIRDGSPTSAYSLGRTQAAWWFFIILGAFLFIVTTTGEINAALNSTALTLLGIGAATAAGAAVVSASKAGDRQEAEERVRQQASEQAQQVAAVQAQADAAPGNAALQGQLQTANQQLAAKTDLLQRIATSDRNEHFLRDILSDADGLSIHRFQMVSWTLVLSFIFAKAVYDGMAMPDFDATLLGLQGVSAATFVGLKMAEPSVPKAAYQ
jgi:hypothetical protein